VPLPTATATGTTPPPDESAAYAVRFLSASEEASDFSNLVVLPVTTAPPAPVDLRVEGTASGVSVIWTVLESRQIAVYRRPAAGRTFGAPVAVIDEAAGSYVDTTAKLGESYAYSVTRVAQAGPTQGSVLVESALAAPIEIAFADRFPPPSPGGLTALKEADRIRLVWQAVSATDLAGYHVFRRTDAGREERLTGMPQAATSFAVPGRTLAGRYVFLVKAVDTQGNESEPTETTVEWP
jgi:fibronectin type 3 domain-containing protein